MIIDGVRPEFPKELVEKRSEDALLGLLMGLPEKCWLENPDDRPSFEQITTLLLAK